MKMKIRPPNVALFLKRVLPHIMLQCVIIIVTLIGSYTFMTWITVGVAKVEDTVHQTFYEILGTVVLMIIILVPLNTFSYQKRAREIETLSDAIGKVACGHYEYRIDTSRKEPITPVYEDFNKMCAELASTQILQNDFINNYSHEFKTPIASISGFASLLLEKDLSKEEQTQFLEIIRDESNRLSALAKNTILLSKLSSQQIVSEVEEYNLGEQLRQCSIICSAQWSAKNQTLSADLPEVMIKANKELLQHLWLNLIGNASKYTPEGGEITVTLVQEKRNVTVTVKDTGEGMSDTTLTNLFRPYFQGDSSHSRQGLGLGLSIAHRIVELFHGQIFVESKIGEGSKFIVTLPIGIPVKKDEPKSEEHNKFTFNLPFDLQSKLKVNK